MQIISRNMWVYLASLLTAITFSFAATPTFAQTMNVPLTSDQAFAFSLALDTNQQVLANWHIAPGYYLYKERFQFSVNGKPYKPASFPQGELKYDPDRGHYEVFSGDILVPLALPITEQAKLTVNYQGCSEDGFCYPPIEKHYIVNFAQHVIHDADVNMTSDATVSNSSLQNLATQQNGVQHLLQTQHFIVQLLILAALGLLLAFTPCVLPMIPILTSIIVGQKNKTTRQAFFLSSTYVLGTAVTYAAAGLAVALVGSSLQVWLQQPIVIATVCGIFILLALSLFGLFELRMPNAIQNKLVQAGNHQRGGTYAGVFAMGMISTLIVSPCVTAPLVGVLLYIAQTGDVVLGASALFALGIGMGIPLMLIGVSAGKWLPKTGPWMILTKHIFGLLMLAMAIWLSARILSPMTIKILTGCLLLLIAGFLSFYLPRILGKHVMNRILGVAASGCGLLLIFGGTHLPTPINSWFDKSALVQTTHDNFIVIHSIPDLKQQILLAKAQHKPILVDFYADWCESCISMDKKVFRQPNIQDALKNYVLLRADLSANSANEEALLNYFKVVAPPTVLFFDLAGQEINSQRIVGEVSAKEFLARLASVNNPDAN